MKQAVLNLHLRVGFALLALLALTVGTSFIALGAWNLVINLVIAAGKASLVLVWFMRIGHSGKSTQFAAAAGVVWLLLMVGLGMTDFVWRQ